MVNFNDEKELKIPNVAEDLSEENQIVEGTNVTEDLSEENQIVEVTGCTRLRLRQKPGLYAPVVKELKVGAKLIVEEFDHPDFYKVTDMDGAYGYVMKSYVK